MSGYMQARAYAITLSASALGLFLAVAVTNLVIDPMGVFGTKLLPRSLNSNDRYLTLAEYQSQPDRFDGLIFGSSRSQSINRDELSRHVGGVTFASFRVNSGTLTDHLTALNYVLRQKAAKGQGIKAVFILLDPDSFGARPFTNQSLTYATPPALSGENPIRFWWRNLMAIQFGVWRSALRETLGTSRPVEPAIVGPLSGNLLWRIIANASPGANAQSVAPTTPPPANTPTAERPTDRPLYPQDLELWRRFVALCRENHIELIVAISPLSQHIESEYDSSDLSKAIDDISRLAPVWDFTGDDQVSSNPALWRDILHFVPEVGARMLERIFGGQVPPEWEHFGRYRRGTATGNADSALEDGSGLAR
jgi:hypothetical protein